MRADLRQPRVRNAMHGALRIIAALAVAGLPARAWCAVAGESPLTAGRLAQVGLGLVLVVVLIGVAGFTIRRVFRIDGGSKGPLRILAGLSMGPRERVVLLEVEDCRLLVGVAPGRIQTLHVLGRVDGSGATERSNSSADNSARAPEFRRVLQQAGKGSRNDNFAFSGVEAPD